MGDEGKPGARQYDQVAINSIWREHVKKERATLTLNENFRLNPHALAVCVGHEHANTAARRPALGTPGPPGAFARRSPPPAAPARAGRSAPGAATRKSGADACAPRVPRET